MASYNIPEEIMGIPLFVPDTYNFFSIESGGMPNGDDCLIVHGDVSTNYKAFQNTQILSPNIFRSNATVYTISFWINFTGNGSNTGGASTLGTSLLFGAMNSSYSGVGTNNSDWLWVVGTHGTGSRVISHACNSSGGGTRTISTGVIPASTWTLVCFRHTSASADPWGAALNLDPYTNGGTGQSSQGTGTAATYFGLGSYSDTGTANGRSGEYRIGKLAFHDHVLSDTERALLYLAMTT